MFDTTRRKVIFIITLTWVAIYPALYFYAASIAVHSYIRFWLEFAIGMHGNPDYFTMYSTEFLTGRAEQLPASMLVGIGGWFLFCLVPLIVTTGILWITAIKGNTPSAD
jgi:hypothetical protein